MRTTKKTNLQEDYNMNEKKLKIERTFSIEEGTDVYKLNKLPDNYLWCYGSILELEMQTKQKIQLVYIDNGELGDVFHNLSTGEITYQEELEELKNIKEIKILIPEANKLVDNYLKGLIVYTLFLTEEIGINERKINYNKKVLEFLIELSKKFKET